MQTLLSILGGCLRALLLSSIPVATASEIPASAERAQLWHVLERVERRLQTAPGARQMRAPVQAWLSGGCRTRDPARWEAEALRAEAADLERDLGMAVNGAFTSGSFNNAESGRDASSYVELSWDLMRNGLQQHRRQAEALRSEARLVELEGDIERLERAQRCRRYAVARHFAARLADLWTLKLELSEPVYHIERRAYFRGWSHLDDLLVAEKDLKTTRDALRELHAWADDEDLFAPAFQAPLIDLDMVAIAQAIEADEHEQRRRQALRQTLALKREARSPSRLKLFLRNELERGSRESSDGGLVAGVRFSVPLARASERPFRLRMLKAEQEAALQDWERLVRTRAAYQDLREQLERVVNQNYRYLRAAERLRRSVSAYRMDGEADLAVAIPRALSATDAAIELARAKEELYRRVNQVFLAARLPFDTAYVRWLPEQSQQQRARTGKRSIYMWSAGFDSVPNPQLFDFLQAQGISEVLLSAGRRGDADKRRAFLRRAAEHDVVTALVIGERSWVYPANHQRAVARALSIADAGGGVHLDVEPHTLPQFDTRSEELLEQYLQMLDAVRTAIGDTRLTVAVPMHWTESVYRRIARRVDGVYVMAYGHGDPAVLRRRLHTVLTSMPAQKLVIAVRSADFEDPWQMEQTIDTLYESTGISRYALHHLGSLIELMSSPS